MAKNSFLEAIAESMQHVAASFGRAVDDVREKVVEQPWFGQATTQQPMMREEITVEHRAKVMQGLRDDIAETLRYQSPDKDRDHERDDGMDR